jgi:hypothetical protein
MTARTARVSSVSQAPLFTWWGQDLEVVGQRDLLAQLFGRDGERVELAAVALVGHERDDLRHVAQLWQLVEMVVGAGVGGQHVASAQRACSSEQEGPERLARALPADDVDGGCLADLRGRERVDEDGRSRAPA